MGPIRAARSSSSRASTTFFSADCGRLKNGTQMHVSTRTRRIRLGGFECAPVVVHGDRSGDLLQAHPAGVPAVLVKGATKRARHVADLRDRKSTRLNSSHSSISYAVF